MPIQKLYELKAKYEKELAVAEAKVAVITDLIAEAQIEEPIEEVVEAEPETPTTDNIY
jgi:hypothetical protein